MRMKKIIKISFSFSLIHKNRHNSKTFFFSGAGNKLDYLLYYNFVFDEQIIAIKCHEYLYTHMTSKIKIDFICESSLDMKHVP